MIHFTDPRELREAMLGLVEIKQQERLAEFCGELNDRLRDASWDLRHCTPNQDHLVHHLAKLAETVLDVDPDECLAAAQSIVLESRLSIALELLREWQEPAAVTINQPVIVPGNSAIQRAQRSAVAQLTKRRRA
jgi:hypothetical protein